MLKSRVAALSCLLLLVIPVFSAPAGHPTLSFNASDGPLMRDCSASTHWRRAALLQIIRIRELHTSSR